VVEVRLPVPLGRDLTWIQFPYDLAGGRDHDLAYSSAIVAVI
jgi:hypothetical protein